MDRLGFKGVVTIKWDKEKIKGSGKNESIGLKRTGEREEWSFQYMHKSCSVSYYW